ncbi:MAG: citrate/2-methylcitrate synthase [Verrucomicrobiota bacterium]
MLLELREAAGKGDSVDSWMQRAFAEHRKLMGFGHRVYKHHSFHWRRDRRRAWESQRGSSTSQRDVSKDEPWHPQRDARTTRF